MANSNFFIGKNIKTQNVNPFENILTEKIPEKIEEESTTISPLYHRLNDLDSVIMEEKAYLDINDHMLKLEYRINLLEDEIKSVDESISDAKLIGNIQDVDIFTIKKREIEEELKILSKKYEELDLSTKLSGEIASVLKRRPKKNFNIFGSVGHFVKFILAKISKKFSSNQNLKFSLQKLYNINKNVDELVNMQTPYGEGGIHYERLTDFIGHANKIHYQISKNLSSLK